MAVDAIFENASRTLISKRLLCASIIAIGISIYWAAIQSGFGARQQTGAAVQVGHAVDIEVLLFGVEGRQRAIDEAHGTSFARAGHPETAHAPSWPAYGARQAYMHFADVPRPETGLMPGMYALNEEVVCRRNAHGGIGWNWNVGLAAPPPMPPPVAARCR